MAAFLVGLPPYLNADPPMQTQTATVTNPEGKDFTPLAQIHPWHGKRVAYFGDSITDPKNKAADRKYWNLLQQWLGITPYVYAVSGRQWNDIPRQAQQLKAEHGDDFDAILIFIGTNDFNAGVPIGEGYTEKEEDVMAGIHEQKRIVKRMRQHLCMTDSTYRGRIHIALEKA